MIAYDLGELMELFVEVGMIGYLCALSAITAAAWVWVRYLKWVQLNYQKRHSCVGKLTYERIPRMEKRADGHFLE